MDSHLKAPTTDAGRVVAYVKSNGSITNSQCRELLGINNDQAYYLLSKLIDDGQLKPEGNGKGRKYVLKGLIDLSGTIPRLIRDVSGRKFGKTPETHKALTNISRSIQNRVRIYSG